MRSTIKLLFLCYIAMDLVDAVFINRSQVLKESLWCVDIPLNSMVGRH